ncbi:hypothetical protein [Paenibacillus ginsengarvi]|uniref:Beta-hexosaminidase bacterial type N-terminal domain-containing protein n=1 Tax=Paenibacillus ginsengarvi TaxID=400777 RepID=A0A3B0BR52_9BACL|nr:hypothetical protein [Paenibacillus ginsengarvi]RKN74951.1 hypothetical protein D7M11_25765 [Paenibacillus ginsengarvi]
MGERNYEFRNRLDVVHKPNRRDPALRPEPDDCVIGEDWFIAISESAGPHLVHVAKDLQDYLLESMNCSVLLRRTADIGELARSGKQVIVLGVKEELPEYADSLSKPRSYRIAAGEDAIVVCGFDERGAGQGSFFLEDLMNLREAPFVTRQNTVREPVFSPRMIHSGWGLDVYPDAHLNAMAHAGIDAILVFVKGIDETPFGYLDFNHVIDRAALHGLDVYMYSYLQSKKHPEDPDAEAYYESTYGHIMEKYSRFKGIVFVGESCEFPSKDPNTTGMLRLEWPADKKRTKPSPGWWPCTDYPQWLDMIKKVTRKHNPELDIVFWTYNWGYVREEERLRLIRSLPTDISLMATFEMFEKFERDGVVHTCVDYTASFEGPGRYFASEAKAAHERGITLYTMANTGGTTWDIGVIPYEPIPYQWARRHAGLLQGHRDWGLNGLMESHHFGWWPSFVSDLAKWAYWTPTPPSEETFVAVARRDFSADAAEHALEAWRLWSEGIRYYIPTNYDQYGPFRIGPSYPLLFREVSHVPQAWYAHFGSKLRIINPVYNPINDHPDYLRLDVEIANLRQMAELWKQGNEALERAIALTPARKHEDANRLLGLNRFIERTVHTVIHTKLWWKLKHRLLAEANAEAAAELASRMAEVAELEIANAAATIPLTEADSRLGWEPSMEYMTDPEHLRWKIAQVREVLDKELPAYIESLGSGDKAVQA